MAQLHGSLAGAGGIGLDFGTTNSAVAELAAIAACVDRVLTTAGVRADEIDGVFLTGGSSFVPAVRKILADRFGTRKITGGSELTSVATGLALRAAEQWPGVAAAGGICA